jgi:hypothetical protein
MLVAHTCPNFSGGRDREDCDLKLAQANSSRDPISKTPITKRGGRVAQDVGPEFKPQNPPPIKEGEVVRNKVG